LEGLKRDGLTIRGLWQRFPAPCRRLAIAGSPEQIVDHMLLWCENNTADGFHFLAALKILSVSLCPSYEHKGLSRIRMRSEVP
jgi:hypothetical protein